MGWLMLVNSVAVEQGRPQSVQYLNFLHRQDCGEGKRVLTALAVHDGAHNRCVRKI
jgi:hypothetical protein